MDLAAVVMKARKAQYASAHDARVDAFVHQPALSIKSSMAKKLLRKASKAKKRVKQGGKGSGRRGNQRMLPKLDDEALKARQRTMRLLHMQRRLGPLSRFGDGDGSWWDRWLVQKPPQVSAFQTGCVAPHSGFKVIRPQRYHVKKGPRDFGFDFEKYNNDRLEARYKFLDRQRARAGPVEAEAGPAQDGEDDYGDWDDAECNTQEATNILASFEERVARSSDRLMHLLKHGTEEEAPEEEQDEEVAAEAPASQRSSRPAGANKGSASGAAVVTAVSADAPAQSEQPPAEAAKSTAAS